MREYSNKQIIDRLETLSGHLANYQKTLDPDGLRLIRVWSRRSSVAMKAFEKNYRSKKFTLLLHELKNTARDIGKVRDGLLLKDIVRKSISVLNEAEKSGVQRLFQLNETALPAETNIAAIASLNSILKTDPLQRFIDIEADIPENNKYAGRKLVKGFKNLVLAANTRQMEKMARKAVRTKQQLVLSSANCLEDPDKIAELHKLRIDIKKLRYTIDLMLPALVSQSELYKNLNALHEKLRELQDSIGAIHDMDYVLHELLSRLTAESAAVRDRALGRNIDGNTDYMTFETGIGLLKIAADIQLKRDGSFHLLYNSWHDNSTTELFRLCSSLSESTAS